MQVAHAADFLLQVVESPGRVFTCKNPLETLSATRIAEGSHGLIEVIKMGKTKGFRCPMQRASAEDLTFEDGRRAHDVVFESFKVNAHYKLTHAEPGDTVWFAQPKCAFLRADWDALVIKPLVDGRVWDPKGVRGEGVVPDS